MAYNLLSGTVIAADKYLPGDLVVNIVSGNLSTSDASSVINVPRISNATNNAVITNVGGDANSLVCESNLTFDGSTLNVVGDITASVGISASFFEGDGSKLTNLPMSEGGGSFTHYSSSRGNNTVLVATASVSWAGNLGTAYSASQAGADTFFFVSGAIGSRGSAVQGVSLFGGDVHVSGNLSTTSIFATGNLNLQGSGSIAGDLIPHEGDTYDLGSAAKPWRDLYISGSSIHFGSEVLSVSDNNLRFGSGSTTKGFDVGFMNFRNNGIFMDPGRIFQLRAYQMQFYGGISYVRRVVADNYTVSTIDYLIGALTHAESSSITLSLPAAGACSNGQTFVIKDEGGAANASPVIISAPGSDTIDGQNSIVLESPYASIQLYCNGIDKYYIC